MKQLSFVFPRYRVYWDGFSFYLCSGLIWGDTAEQLQLTGSAWSGHLCALLVPAQCLRWTQVGGGAGDTDLGCAHVPPAAPLASKGPAGSPGLPVGRSLQGRGEREGIAT